MQAGDLDRRVGFDAPTSASDGYGATVEGWTETHVCWAHFRYLRGGETVVAARLAGRQVVVATVRMCAAVREITTGYRMRDVRDGTRFNVRSVVPSDDLAWLEVTAESGVTI
jgi:head-tail adaptor